MRFTNFLSAAYNLRQAGILTGLTVLSFTIAACGDFIQIVPVTSLTPAPATPIRQEPAEAIESIPAHSAPTHIAAEIIGLDAAVVAMGWQTIEQNGLYISEWDMPENEAAWHQNSARPGEGSNIVISGHNESTGGQVFAEIEELQVGDEITLWADNNEPFVYQVIEKNIIRTFAASAEAQDYLRTVTEPTDGEQLTLITCWPRWTNTHRLIVIAAPKQIATSSR